MRYLTAGESHGKALTGIMDGCPFGLKIDINQINFDLYRRTLGYGRGGRMKIEKDEVEFLSGLRNSVTLGSPIAVKIDNKDFINWADCMDPAVCDITKKTVTEMRPGHADLSGCVKFDTKDARNILERASARNTAATVALGGIAKQFLAALGIKTASRVISIGGVKDTAVYEFSDLSNPEKKDINTSCLDKKTSEKMIEAIKKAEAEGDTLGGEIEVITRGVKTGIGSHTQYDQRLDFMLMGAAGGLQGVKSVSIGAGISFSDKKGTEIHDRLYVNDDKKIIRKTNNAGGIEGGISNGEDIVIRAVFKPIPTTMKGVDSVDIITKKPCVSAKERSDTTAVPAAAVVLEAIVALTLMQAVLVKTGGDSMNEIQTRWLALE